jgi:dUTPase
VAVAPPEQYALILKERSGLALKGIGIKGGVIDNGYRGELKAIVQWIPPEGFGAASADINIFKLGNMSEGRPATEEQMQTLADALQHVNDDVPLNLIWNEDIELEVLKLGTFEIKAGDKICQGKLELTRDHCPVVEVDDLGETPRGADGFGSTGT